MVCMFFFLLFRRKSKRESSTNKPQSSFLLLLLHFIRFFFHFLCLAADVAQSVNFFLTMLDANWYLSDDDLFALILAALFHVCFFFVALCYE